MKYFLIVLMLCGCCISGCAVLKKNPDASPADMSKTGLLNGKWQLIAVEGDQSMEKLYSGKKPFIEFNAAKNLVNGNTGCNSFGTSYVADGDKITFNQAMRMTKMFCPGNGEQFFVSTLSRVETFSMSTDHKVLNLISGGGTVLSFARQ